MFLDALDDPELAFQVHTQRPRVLDSAVQMAQYMEAVMHSFPSRPSKPVQAVVQAGDEGKNEAELKDLWAGQRHLLNFLAQFSKWVENSPPKQMSSDARSPLTVPGDSADLRPSGSDGVRRVPRSSACFTCGREGHYANDCVRTRLESRKPQVSATEPSSAGSNPTALRKNNSVHFREK